MKNQDLTITLLVDQPANVVFNAVNNVHEWWSEGTDGRAQKLNDEFRYWHKDMHYSKQRVVELVPDKKVVWLVTESELSFLQAKSEWTDTKIMFEISNVGDKTQLRFTHVGLTPAVECFDDCSIGWDYYVGNSLLKLITTGKGEPDSVEIAQMHKV